MQPSCAGSCWRLCPVPTFCACRCRSRFPADARSPTSRSAHDAGPRHHPPSAELVVEVAVTSLNDDLAKLAGYAAANVKVAWIVDVPARTVRVFDQPHGLRYARERILAGDDTLSAPVDGVSRLTVRALFAVLEA